MKPISQYFETLKPNAEPSSKSTDLNTEKWKSTNTNSN